MAQILNRSDNTIHDIPLIDYDTWMRKSLKDRLGDFIEDHLMLTRSLVVLLLVAVIALCIWVDWFGVLVLIGFLVAIGIACFWALACGIVDWIEELLL